jgi:nucleoside 2-deoxyribosyltransferase
MTIHVVGGVYREYCVHPRWNDVYGSAGRAALAIATMGSSVTLHSYFGPGALEVFQEKAAWIPGLAIQDTQVPTAVGFKYLHDMAVPEISGVPAQRYEPLRISEERVVRFGMLEGDAVVTAEWAVYDPQNERSAEPFGANGSTAKHLALVLNAWEAAQMANMPAEHPSVTAPVIGAQQNAEVVIVKMGPEGAFVWTAAGTAQVPAFRTSHVWKIGSGDCFVAHFANAWMHDGLAPVDAALAASRATAFYCDTKGFPTAADLSASTYPAIQVSPNYTEGKRPQVYLAGPFFDLAQVWMVEQAYMTLKGFGLKVFSPYHDIGLGSADDVVAKDLEGIRQSDLLFAITDGLDAGTIYEIGYARALDKPVVVYNERHKDESHKMMEGSSCVVCHDYTTAAYTVLWEAVKL